METGMDERTILLTNDNGVILSSPYRSRSTHCHAVNAICCCRSDLIVAPEIFLNGKQDKKNPIMMCTDHGVHAYYFEDLTVGIQSKDKLIPRG